MVNLRDNFEKNRIIPKPRGKLPVILSAAIACILFCIGIFNWDCKQFFRYTVLNCLLFSLCGILKGICLFVEELFNHSSSRYHGNLIKMLNACFNWCHFLCIAMVIFSNLLETVDVFKAIVTCTCFLLYTALGLWNPTSAEVSEICEMKKMNVAHGLAWSFYVGYLGLVLPRLQESIEAYHKHKATVLKHRDTWKLHILIPLSCSVPDKLEETDNNIRFYENLPDTMIDRAGIRKRVFKHSIYSIYDEAMRPHYCVVEYATPLLTLYKMSQEASAGFSAEERLQQATLFFRTLQVILDDSLECRNHYRLILLDGYHLLSCRLSPW
ncbi:stimulator of interferon genes protein isoform X2 [Amia ocellicauda]|uniref:stimulator of interferon genes protein isoform X2 n=1 Tax=Amia ocellicauda TaxID=2972642 RepID=UPI003464AF0B